MLLEVDHGCLSSAELLGRANDLLLVIDLLLRVRELLGRCVVSEDSRLAAYLDKPTRQ